ncbi:MAG: hypothetical protein QM784_39440 [Polyangiaceae bacterium]
MSHPSFAPPPGFDELPTGAKVDYVSQLWDLVLEHKDLESPAWHRDLVRAELEEQRTAPNASEDWNTARSEILDRIRQVGR